MTVIRQGQIRALFAFDIGYAVDLDRLRGLAPVVTAPPLSRKKQTPTYMQYTTPPCQLTLGAAPGGFRPGGMAQATVFDFGALSLSWWWPITGKDCLTIDDLPLLGQQLQHLDLELQARAEIAKLVERISAAIDRPRIDTLVEDYYLFILERLDEDLTADQLLHRHRPGLAQALRFETIKLSASQQEEALSESISYYENDLAIIDWNAAILYDQDYEDSVSVLEFLNIELLEARYVDARLDRRLTSYGPLPPTSRLGPIPFRIPYRQAIEDLAELRTEYLLLNERVDNALKLIGDLYLARLHYAAARRFYLHEWNLTISRKLEIIDDLYEMLNDRARTTQGQMLELIIILLILVELVIGLLR